MKKIVFACLVFVGFVGIRTATLFGQETVSTEEEKTYEELYQENLYLQSELYKLKLQYNYLQNYYKIPQPIPNGITSLQNYSSGFLK